MSDRLQRRRSAAIFSAVDRPFRVQIPAYTDRWMMGDRYGEVTATRIVSRTDDASYPVEQWRVRLDKSGKSIVVVSDDCVCV